MKNHNYLFLLIVIFFIFVNKAKSYNRDGKGKCVYFISDSEVYDFHKYSNKNTNEKNYIFDIEEKNKDNEKIDEDKWFINICNDTLFECNETNINNYSSQIVYCEDKENCTKFTGGFHRPIDETGHMFFDGDKNQFTFNPRKGDICVNYTYNPLHYQTEIIFENSDPREDNKAIITSLPELLICSNTVKVKINYEYAKDYLLLEKVLNDYYIITGLLFIALGIFLCFFAWKYINVNKIIIAITFSEIIVFFFGLVVLKLYSKDSEIYLFLIGLPIGGIIGFLILKNDLLTIYNIILALTAGFIFGIFVFDLTFAYYNYHLIIALFTDCCLIFISTSIVVITLFPKQNLYFNSIIGGYIIIRGVSLFIYKVLGSIRYRDLQVLFYLTNRYETEFTDYFLDKEFHFSWLYDLLIGLLMLISGSFYYLAHVYHGNEDEEKDDDDEVEEQEN